LFKWNKFLNNITLKMFAHQISIAFVDLMSIWWKNIVYFCKTKVKTLFITNGKNVLDSFQNRILKYESCVEWA